MSLKPQVFWVSIGSGVIRRQKQDGYGQQPMKVSGWQARFIQIKSGIAAILSPRMKTSSIVIALLATLIVNARAQVASTSATASQFALPAPTEYRVVDRGANHRVWQRETYEQSPDGKIVTHVHSYTELATGLHYRDASTGQWVESQELIEPFSGGAVARYGQHQVIFANNLNTAGAIDMQTPDGKRLRSNILGLMYHDTATDEAVLIAGLQDSTGELVSSNQVLYPNAFQGIKADVRYTYKKGSFEQDVILREQPPAPDVYGMNPDTTEIEVMTEFINPPEAILTQGAGQTDEGINWGDMRIVRGKAFDLAAPDNKQARAVVVKNYLNVQGRHVLLEKVKLRQVQSSLSKLPLQSSIPIKSAIMLAKNLKLPGSPPGKLADRQPIKLARSTPSNQGYVLDYVTVNSSVSNYTFQGDMTYYVSGWDSLSGTTTVEGGTVIKFSSNPNDGPALDLYGALQCKAGSYRQVIFTSKDDNTVGEGVSGSSGSPAVVTNAYFLILDGPITSVNNLRFCYAQNALAPNYSGPVDVWDCQFTKCQTAIDYWLSSDIKLHNVLFALCGSVAAFEVGVGPSLIGENITVDGANLIDTNLVYAVAINLTNSILRCSPSSLWATTVSTNSTVINPSGPLFMTVGGGSYYLTNYSAYRDMGTTNVDPGLFAILQKKTTYPPVVYTGVRFTSITNLAPQPIRDSNTLDLGYHYDAFDYVFGGCDLFTNVNFAAGTAVGWYFAFGGVSSSGQPYGVSLNNGAKLSFNGTAALPCGLAMTKTVQEGVNNNWTSVGWMPAVMFNGSGASPLPQMNGNFLKWYSIITYGGFRDNWNYGVGNFQNCEFYNGNNASYAPSLYFTNCLFQRVQTDFFSQTANGSFTYQNCTFNEGFLEFCRGYWVSATTNTVWRVMNTAFNGTGFNWTDTLNANTNCTFFDYNSYNAANTNWQIYPWPYPPQYGRLEVVGPHDLTISNGYNWQTSWLGDFYLPTNSLLINVGSTTSDQLGLYHFTTQTNQIKETNSIVDIGYHYVATDAYGNPYDTDGDGQADYLEDANGNGVFDAGDLGNWLINAFNGLSAGFGLQVYTPLK